MQNIYMDDVNTNAIPYIDALVAFWPGLQVLVGDLKPAIIYHQLLYHGTVSAGPCGMPNGV